MKMSLAPTGTRRWMLVDDNADILLMLSAVLEHFTDASIECHDSPQSALAAFASAPDCYEVVFTDFEMPGMNGFELCRRLRSMVPEQKVFLATGSGHFTEAGARNAGFLALLEKPFAIEAMRKALGAAKIGTKAGEPT